MKMNTLLKILSDVEKEKNVESFVWYMRDMTSKFLIDIFDFVVMCNITSLKILGVKRHGNLTKIWEQMCCPIFIVLAVS